jgi:DNA/RNA endonuclease G (NUC1)
MPIRPTLVFALLCVPAAADDTIPAPAKYGTPDAAYATHGGYLSAFDPRTRNPRWVLERIDRTSLRNVVKRDTEKFRPDSSLPAVFRVDDRDYLRSQWDRGHLAAAANHLASQADLDSTFLFSNTMPQSAPCNRGIWARLEAEIRDLAEQEDVGAVFVLTLPLWSAGPDGMVRHAVIGPHRVFVPTHCGKSVLIERGDRLELRAWMVPNLDCGSLETHHFRCPVDLLESEAALDFWAALEDSEEAELEAVK